jgi:thiopeptide-type bacteriocin biosynthesis protein
VLGPYARTRAVGRVSVDTYDRETYRYGGARGMELAERVFHRSSEIALALHASTVFDAESDAELEAMMVPYVSSLRALLDATGLPLAEQRQIALDAAASYTRGKDANVPRKRAAEFYRTIRDRLGSWGAELDELAKEHLGALRTILADARSADLSCPLPRWLVDCLHVHSIRLLTTWHPVADVEATAYHVLEKLLGKEMAVPKEPAR